MGIMPLDFAQDELDGFRIARAPMKTLFESGDVQIISVYDQSEKTHILYYIKGQRCESYLYDDWMDALIHLPRYIRNYFL